MHINYRRKNKHKSLRRRGRKYAYSYRPRSLKSVRNRSARDWRILTRRLMDLERFDELPDRRPKTVYRDLWRFY